MGYMWDLSQSSMRYVRRCASERSYGERMLKPGWWVELGGEETYLRELTMHFNAPELAVVEDEDRFYLGSTDFAAMTSTDEVRHRAAELVSIASALPKLSSVAFGRRTSSRPVALTTWVVGERLTGVSSAVRPGGAPAGRAGPRGRCR
jgi:hypothetical protein